VQLRDQERGWAGNSYIKLPIVTFAKRTDRDNLVLDQRAFEPFDLPGSVFPMPAQSCASSTSTSKRLWYKRST
jgi:hypothetical protein